MKKLFLNKPYSIILFIILGVFSHITCAHQIRMSVYVEGNAVEGEIYYVGGGNPPGAGAKVEFLKDDKVVYKITADDEGLFNLGEITPDSYTVRADGSQGHVAFYELDKSEFMLDETTEEEVKTEDLSQQHFENTSLTKEELQKAISHAIRPLREQIDRYEAKTRLHDILGGIGYILGLFGLMIIIRAK